MPTSIGRRGEIFIKTGKKNTRVKSLSLTTLNGQNLF